MPLEKHVPTPVGKRVGGVSETPTRKPGEAILHKFPSRDGGRHLGLPDGAALRGAVLEGRPWPVRYVGRGLLLFRRSRRRQRVSSGRRGGERRRHARKGACTLAEAKGLLERDASFARSRDPCTSIATTLRRRKPTKVAREVEHRGRANLRKREEPAPGFHPADGARLAACAPLPQGRQRGTSEKEGGCGLRPCENTRARAFARTS